MVVDCALYECGARRPGTLAVADALEAARSSSSPGAFVWIGLHQPTEDEFGAVSKELELHPLAVEDAIHAHQRPKLETYGETLFCVLKPAMYVDHEEVVRIGELMMFLGPDFVVTVRHGESAIFADVRRQLEEDPPRLECGPLGVLYTVVDRVVDDYGLVLRGLEDDIDDIECQVFSADRRNHAERIYKLKREVLEFRQAVVPLADPLEELAKGKVAKAEVALLEYFRDVHDHVVRITERVEGFDTLLDGALSANLAQVGVRQNEDMRKISAWVAIIAMPTMIAGVYGMNFEHMLELGWALGYPFALSLMAGSCLFLYSLFRRRDWL
ncbi:MAG: magnesium and cobalt transport protein CorA [Actinomycetota bacterium]|nr:magnesium and cobalt transport protein CorA [Actinomycetota bacterium]